MTVTLISVRPAGLEDTVVFFGARADDGAEWLVAMPAVPPATIGQRVELHDAVMFVAVD